MTCRHRHARFSFLPAARFGPIVLVALVLLNGVGLPGYAAPNAGETSLMPLTSDAATAKPRWRLLPAGANTMRLVFELDGLQRRVQGQAGHVWHELLIEGGATLGNEGQPGLPAAGHLVAIPAGASVRARVLAFEARELTDLHLLPVPGDRSGDGINSFDAAAYERPGWTKVEPGPAGVRAANTADSSESGPAPAVLVGQPARLAGQDVVALTVGPLVYDPVRRTARVAYRIEIELTFAVDQSSPAASGNRRAGHGGAFAAMLTAKALGYDSSAKTASPQAYGTWAVVCRNADAAVHLQPLVTWRARQGYHTEVLNVGASTAPLIKAQLQAIYDDTALPPLEFILLAGDTESAYAVPTWFESLSGYDGEGDHYYATLAGHDFLADAHVGRLSFTDLAMLDTIVAKIVAYEQTPPMDDTSWFTAGCVMGDPTDSGITTIYVNQWLKGQMLANGYAAVDTIWSGDFINQFMNALTPGRSAFGYRGFWNMSGVQPGHILALSNGGRLPVAVLPTCDTGSFVGEFTCHSEAFLRAPNGGGIAAVATATPGTHTRYNNCFYQGIWDGLLNAGDPRIGVAHTLGKLELFNNYALADPEAAEIWAVWNNIMGDPASAIWLGVPRQLDVTHAAQLSVGSNALEVAVAAAGAPVANAIVCLYRAGSIQVSGRTDASGHVVLATGPLTAGVLHVTVTGRGLFPYRGIVPVGALNPACSLGDHALDDDTVGVSDGNGDGLLNPGEIVEISLAVANLGTDPALSLSGQLGDAPWSSVTAADVIFGDVAAGATVWSDTPAVVAIDPAAPDGATLSWPVQIQAGADSWPGLVSAEVYAAALAVTETVWSAGAKFEPGQSGQLVVRLANDGRLAADAVGATLTTSSPWIQITDADGSFGFLAIGANGDNSADPFTLDIAPSCHAGHLALMELAVTYGDGMQTTVDFAFTVGTTTTTDPSGPDNGGYYAFDDTDVGNFYAPVYDWVALDPDHGGPGVDLGLTDFGWEQDDTRTIDLPFTFRYYGVDFARVSICSNGWLAMGETPLVHYRNYGIPSKGSPGGMIAPFWDNLYQEGSRRVYTHYDEAEHRFIVQWYRLFNDFSDAVQNFEVILLDPLWHPTATGDGALVFQYEAVGNTDSRDGYATVGLQNLDRTGGLLYTYWNQYAAGAAPLQSGRAIRFQPLGEVALPVASVLPLSITQTLVPDDVARRTLHITNAGDAGSVLSFRIEPVDPATLAKGATAAPPADKSIQGSTLTMAATEYVPGTTVDLEISVQAVVSFMGFLSHVMLSLPAGVTCNSAEDFILPSGNRFFWRGPAGEGVVTTWDGLDNGWIYILDDGDTTRTTVNVTFDPDLTGDLTFGYRLEDVGYFGVPDVVDGTVVLSNNLPSVRIHAPDADATAVIGQIMPITFTMLNASGLADIALQREPAGNWETLAVQVDAAPGSWPWTVAGAPGPYAKLRVADSQDASVFDESEVFVVGRDLSWLQPVATSGTAAAGATFALDLNLDSTGLALGSYSAVVVIETNSGAVLTVPIDLTVTDPSAVSDALPRQVVLGGAHPNPFNPATTVDFSVPSDMHVTLDVFNARGQRVRRLLDGPQTAGPHQVMWNGTDGEGRRLASGVYLLRLNTPGHTLTDKVLLAK